MLSIDPTAKISALADIEGCRCAGTKITIGARTMVDFFAEIKPAGGSGDVIIGQDCALNSGTVLYTGNGIRMGDGCRSPPTAPWLPTNHEFADPDRRIRDQGFQPSRGGSSSRTMFGWAPMWWSSTAR